MSKLANWITKNWKEIWGHGLTVNEERHGFYVTVPLNLICEELDVTQEDLMYGKEVEA